jgi:hypothetical protein
MISAVKQGDCPNGFKDSGEYRPGSDAKGIEFEI